MLKTKRMARRMKAQYIFPVLLIVLDIGSAVVYATRGNTRMAVYWLAAAVLNTAVTF